MMADEDVSQTFSEKPDPQEKRVSGDDINPSQEQQVILARPPKSLVDWLARLNQRYLAFSQDKNNDTG
jgi:hypothetical protein